MLELNLSVIAEIAEVKAEENTAFRGFLKEWDSEELDGYVQELNKELSPHIDCTSCGNCCRQLMINLEDEDVLRLAEAIDLDYGEFSEKYVERSSEGSMQIMNSIPCHFLSDNKCQHYLSRPAECREFPGLHQPAFKNRMFATFMHYGRCPIVFNVIECLKQRTGFSIPV